MTQRSPSRSRSDYAVVGGSSNLRKTFVNNLEVVASVGVYRHEQHYEQRVLISLTLTVIDRYDEATDRIEDVYNYEEAIRNARLIAESTHFNLIETLAERIAEECLQNRDVVRVKVRIEKPDAVEGCAAVGIEIVRDRRT